MGVKTITLTCPQCGAKITTPETNAGKIGKCPNCKQPITVPVPLRETPEDDFLVFLGPEARPSAGKAQSTDQPAADSLAAVDGQPREWTVADGETRHGPLTKEEVIQGVQDGKYPPEALVMHARAGGWRPISETPEFKPYVLPAVPATANVEVGSKPSYGNVREMLQDNATWGTRRQKKLASFCCPWLRFWARTVDGLLYVAGIVVLTILILGEPLSAEDSAPFSIIVLVFQLFVEPALLCTWGYTPGKWLFELAVRRLDGRKLSFVMALKRLLLLYWRIYVFWGLGCLPFYTLWAQSNAQRRLMRGEETTWDEKTPSVVLHERIVGVRQILILLLALPVLGALLFLILAFFFVLSR